MKKIVLCLAFCLLFSVNVFAEQATFTDVPIDSPYYEAVEYIADKGITVGNGNGCFYPDKAITLQEYATMLMRAYSDYQSPGPLAITFHKGWIDMNVVSQEPNKPILLSAVYKSALKAKGVDVYSLDGGYVDFDDYLFVAKSWGLCDFNASPNSEITRGEVAELFFYLDNRDCTLKKPEILSKLNVINTTNENLGDYTLFLEKVPSVIIDKFHDMGWTFKIDGAEIARYNNEYKTVAIGLCDYGKETIYVINPNAVIHEFGHFIDYASDGTLGLSYLYNIESDLLFKSKNPNEYFAESFVAYLFENEKFKELCPETFKYFESLEKDNWGI